jgi:hypothetical protein
LSTLAALLNLELEVAQQVAVIAMMKDQVVIDFSR